MGSFTAESFIVRLCDYTTSPSGSRLSDFADVGAIPIQGADVHHGRLREDAPHLIINGNVPSTLT